MEAIPPREPLAMKSESFLRLWIDFRTMLLNIAEAILGAGTILFAADAHQGRARLQSALRYKAARLSLAPPDPCSIAFRCHCHAAADSKFFGWSSPF
jgi:hypothetical protein